MCFSTNIDIKTSTYQNHFKVNVSVEDEKGFLRCRSFPHKNFPVVYQKGDERICERMNYSLIPEWSETSQPKFSTYNARIESICEKPTWKKSLKRYRCLVGFTSFFESCRQGEFAGNIVEFQSDRLWTAAGIYSVWFDEKNETSLSSFAIVTTEPSPFIEKIGHDRSPVFLSEKDQAAWIRPVLRGSHDAREFLLKAHQPINDCSVQVERPLKT